MTTETRRGTTPIKVWVTPAEKEEIQGNAESCGFSASKYLRSLGMGYEPPSILDSQHILELAKINADQGRLGGLLKMWLTNEERDQAVIGPQLERLLEQIEQAQNQLLEAVERL